MNSCPLSLNTLFLLITAFEGLSLWSAFGGLPNALKRIDLAASWEKVKSEVLEKKGKEPLNREFRKFLHACNWFCFFGWIVRILKSIPVIESLGALVFYSIYPIYMQQSASSVFYNHWRWICRFIAISASVRVIAFFVAWWFFNRFEQKYGKKVVFVDVDPGKDDYSVLTSS